MRQPPTGLVIQSTHLIQHGLCCYGLPMEHKSRLDELLFSRSWMYKAELHEVYQSFRSQVLRVKHVYQSTFGQKGCTHQLFLSRRETGYQQSPLAQCQ